LALVAARSAGRRMAEIIVACNSRNKIKILLIGVPNKPMPKSPTIWRSFAANRQAGPAGSAVPPPLLDCGKIGWCRANWPGLKADLGVRLIQRSTRRFALTEIGAEVLQGGPRKGRGGTGQ